MITATALRATRFHVTRFHEGYDIGEVDELLERLASTLTAHERREPERATVTVEDLEAAQFTTRQGGGYDVVEVDDLLDLGLEALRQHEEVATTAASVEAAAWAAATAAATASASAAPLDDGALLSAVTASYEAPYAETGYDEAPHVEAPYAETAYDEAPYAPEESFAELAYARQVALTEPTSAPEAQVEETAGALDAPFAEAPFAETPEAEAPTAEAPYAPEAFASSEAPEAPVPVESPTAMACSAVARELNLAQATSSGNDHDVLLVEGPDGTRWVATSVTRTDAGVILTFA